MKTNFAIITVKMESIVVETESGIQFGSRKSFDGFVGYFKAIGLEQVDHYVDDDRNGHYVFGRR